MLLFEDEMGFFFRYNKIIYRYVFVISINNYYNENIKIILFMLYYIIYNDFIIVVV